MPFVHVHRTKAYDFMLDVQCNWRQKDPAGFINVQSVAEPLRKSGAGRGVQLP